METIDEAQHRRLEARIDALRLDRARIKRWCKAKWGIAHLTALPPRQYEELLVKLDDFAERVAIEAEAGQ